MAEWLVERGIGEDRAIRLDGAEVIAARLECHGGHKAGAVAEARLVSRRAGSRRGTLRFSDGTQALVSGLDARASEGADLRVVITREAIAEEGRFKLAQCRPTDRPIAPAPSLFERLAANGDAARAVNAFPAGAWEDILSDAFHGEIAFAGGSLLVCATPAMTLIDVDGAAPPRELARASAAAAARAIARLDLSGAIGIDFPSLERREDRRAVDEALARALRDWPHQATAMNGFGFVQLVARLERASILHLVALDRPASAARALLRQAERVADPGRLLLTAHPAVHAAVTADWEAELSRRTGREILWQTDPALAIESGFAQASPA
ncbi:ribonuclease [Novosphingobium sp. PC22D]|uniref:ribonuclease E/G n=1 Tax=Novosphingobium sp. PC22D TaxID=1962403 RepID=UPI000BF02429|nr:ribonuclease E/G [Novosphingobium sp. PC22D]PEQ11853.1 ribonuclease [Novosphingobium sp. PC22D]